MALERHLHKKMLYGALLRTIGHIPGVVVELGVHRGYGIPILIRALQEVSQNRLIYGYDSWQPFPALQVQDMIPGSEAEARCGLHQVSSQDAVLQFLTAKGWPLGNVHLIEGWIEDTLPSLEYPIAFAVMDLDIYASYANALPILWGKMPKEAIVVFDEYHDGRWPGPKEAVDNFLATVPHQLNKDFRWWARKF